MAEIAATGGNAFAYGCNVAEEGEVLQMYAHIDAQDGILYGLVNNAGIVERQTRLDEMELDRWKRIFDVNVFGSFLCTREAVKRMSTRYEGSGGAIVNVSSVASRLGAAFEYVDYAASKGAMDTMTVGLAKEVATEGIRVNGVAPGLIYTDIHTDSGQPDRVNQNAHKLPMQRGGEPEEVAALIMWLISDEASYVTGSTIEVSGGR